MPEGATPVEFEFVAQIVWQDWAHHVGAPWTENVGGWCVFPMGTVEYGWPSAGQRLALEMTAADMEELRMSASANVPEMNPQPLPGLVPPPAPIPQPEPDPVLN